MSIAPFSLEQRCMGTFAAHRWFIFTLFLLLVSPASSAQPYIGSFDPCFILLFHPEMRDFDPCVHRFKKTPSSKARLKDWNTERKTMLSGLKHQKNILTNHQNLKRLYQELSALKQKGLDSDEFAKEHERIREKWIDGLNLQFSPEDFFEFFCSREECISRFKSMWKDVLKSMRKLTQSNPELLFFFPTSHGVARQKLRSSFQLRKNQLHGFSSFTLWFYHQKMVASPKDMELWFRDYLGRRSEIERIFSPHLESDLFLCGYTDVTSSIISTIYEKYPSLEWMADIVNRIYEEWKKQ